MRLGGRRMRFYRSWIPATRQYRGQYRGVRQMGAYPLLRSHLPGLRLYAPCPNPGRQFQLSFLLFTLVGGVFACANAESGDNAPLLPKKPVI